MAEVLRRGTVDNISVILVVLNVPAGPAANGGSANPYQYYNSSSVMHSGASAAPGGPFAVQRRYSGTTPSTAEHLRNSHSTEALNPHHPLRSPRDFSVDMPIHMGYGSRVSGGGLASSGTPQRPFQPTSLNSVFSNIAAAGGNGSNNSLNRGYEEDLGMVSSPLNTMAGSSGRVRKQLQFHDS